MTNVLFMPDVRSYLNSLVPILYKLEYFSYLESSKKYIKALVDDITDNLPYRVHKPAPKYFEQFGKDMYYASFRKNRQTTWYAFFNKYNVDDEIVYLVRYITNNHVVAQHI